jgi:hypothetical protein
LHVHHPCVLGMQAEEEYGMTQTMYHGKVWSELVASVMVQLSSMMQAVVRPPLLLPHCPGLVQQKFTTTISASSTQPALQSSVLQFTNKTLCSCVNVECKQNTLLLRECWVQRNTHTCCLNAMLSRITTVAPGGSCHLLKQHLECVGYQQQ